MAMLIGELEYDDMVQDVKETIDGNITGNGNIKQLVNVTIKSDIIPLPFPRTDHLFIFLFVFFMSIIMINLLFGLAVSDVQVISS